MCYYSVHLQFVLARKSTCSLGAMLQALLGIERLHRCSFWCIHMGKSHFSTHTSKRHTAVLSTPSSQHPASRHPGSPAKWLSWRGSTCWNQCSSTVAYATLKKKIKLREYFVLILKKKTTTCVSGHVLKLVEIELETKTFQLTQIWGGRSEMDFQQ